jgi:hypothetical protein
MAAHPGAGPGAGNVGDRPPGVNRARTSSRRPGAAAGDPEVEARVNPSVAVEPVLLGGVERVWCACCLEFLGPRLPASHLATTPGYDAEGQVINAHFPELTPTGRRWYRSPWTQECLEVELRTIARRRGIEPPEPLFLAS